MIYQLYKTNLLSSEADAAMTIGVNSQTSFIFHPDNTDYQRFKIDLANGAELSDANNTVMTANQISAFIATLP